MMSISIGSFMLVRSTAVGQPYPLKDVKKLTDPALKSLVPRLLCDNAARLNANQLQAEPYFESEAVVDAWGRVDVGQQLATASCRQALLDTVDFDSLGILQPEVAAIVARIDARMARLGAGLSEAERNHRFAMYLYTIQSPVYPKFNAALRERPAGAMFDAWSPFLWHLMAALCRCVSSPEMKVFRGVTDAPNLASYVKSAKIHWSGFSSTSVNPAVAQGFAGGGVVFVITTSNAKDIQPYSWFGTGEAEFLLNPNMEFVVSGSVAG